MNRRIQTLFPLPLAYVAFFAAAGASQPFMPLWLSRHGLNGADIALAMAVPMILRIGTGPAIGWLADRTGNRRMLMRSLALTAAAAGLVCLHLYGFTALIVPTAIMLCAWQAVLPLLEANAIDLVRTGAVRSYGHIRLWGSASFIAVSTGCGGLIAAAGADLVPIIFIISNFALFFFVFLLPDERSQQTGSIGMSRHTGDGKPHRPFLLLIMGAAALIQASHMPFNTFGSVLLAREGYGEFSIGLLWSAASVAEIGMFWLGPVVARFLQPVLLLAFAATVALLRWGLFLCFPDSPGMVILAQLLHAFTFSGTYLGLMGFIAARVPGERIARVQGQYVTIQALTSAAVTLTSGSVFRADGNAVYAIALVATCCALVLLAVARSLQSRD
ncbi:MFS transporter (plasmid) [Agrobacterium tumefaciens]|uniref:MFS transporter n=1 Tax=Agrobacterium tumefaciens TaxID=358 RepID=A0AAP9EAD7_AGRTU|nr:MFS transporter [Agrobacterium tumefaciens]NSZ61188.1 MFS transporter [Agrobacterium tumefaciens]QDY97597.1 MFS transporter [Agrobacterium tumefaciens]UXS12724.1 MFS transporter [Agrobacterium tumefaciens]UXS20086.1 MFS transporter [Agrobacterium tumefaciens]UXS27734.1 MFS transporter [Agrobacterium tumefaciens]